MATSLSPTLVRMDGVQVGDIFAGADRDNGRDPMLFGRPVREVRTYCDAETGETSHVHLSLGRLGAYYARLDFPVWVLRAGA